MKASTSLLRSSYTKISAHHTFTHAEKVLFTVNRISDGVAGEPVATKQIREAWPKRLYGVVFHHNYITECEDAGWIHMLSVGRYCMTDEGKEHLASIIDPSARSAPLADKTELFVFSAKQAHDFDQMLRSALSTAKSSILIADSYVDETIFQTLLVSIPSSVRIDLMYNKDGGAAFHQQAKRFKIQYPEFHYGYYPKLHDRFMVIDGVGFVIGPSLKDATINAPALVVRIDVNQSKKLTALFQNIYSNISKHF